MVCAKLKVNTDTIVTALHCQTQRASARLLRPEQRNTDTLIRLIGLAASACSLH
ncbi:hypothetical protein JZ751_003527 [Albula glossodonta]|uniref:Uncharacterized protein n=1 Tax=Albula glossodonta TaxID=121402 RepID=A0A8T2N903_9TELE|nr:hypothetical protein JZ751_003527 [Albula glossodonta]